MMCARATGHDRRVCDGCGKWPYGIPDEQGDAAHPTYDEGIGEALEELEGGAIHVVPRKKR